MKTTIELPDELLRAVKVRAVNENRKLKDMVAVLLRRGLEDQRAGTKRVALPLVIGARSATPDTEMTPDRVAAILLIDDEPAN